MKIDIYTKILLTVIAVNLTIITIKDLNVIPSIHASTSIDSSEFVPRTNYGLVPLNADGTISVSLTNSKAIDVNIVGIDTYDELDINIDEIGGGYLSHGGPISVKIE
ncbi:hypothetical protein [Tenacibaculum sp. SG-28]|uniref:hypothetical protein n=1 Tax=Tenacibaculum sp. SG-28 TaxID=754426 RepID=UPI000CF47DEA|nr:hypothetical protein [Tenacibaculum sp. SG-28]PQJ19642.1 hypothetical protein BSU00_11685 [Tenacibaculum sp. SG-28]